jgi:peptidoglycan hydrolase-like protein with peptidoglycan-binding domain
LPKVYSKVRPATPTPEVEVQEGLTMRGFYIGAVDGRIGARTRAAIRQYQQEANLPVDGQVTPELAQRMRDQGALSRHLVGSSNYTIELRNSTTQSYGKIAASLQNRHYHAIYVI